MRRIIAFDERGDTAVAGISIKLRDWSDAAQAEVVAAGFRVRARIGDIAVLDVAADETNEMKKTARPRRILICVEVSLCLMLTTSSCAGGWGIWKSRRCFEK